jgi:hypothetical protein
MYSSPNILRVIKSRRMRWAEHVARMREDRDMYRVWWENLRGKDQWGDPGVEGRIILRIFKKWDVGYGLDWTGSG